MGAVSDRRTMDRQPRISWLKPKKKKKEKGYPLPDVQLDLPEIEKQTLKRIIAR